MLATLALLGMPPPPPPPRRAFCWAAAVAATVVLLLSASAPAEAAQCTDRRGATAPCGPGNSDCNASAPPPLPRYHVIDYSCGENDPNGPCFDEKHQVYHLFCECLQYNVHCAVLSSCSRH